MKITVTIFGLCLVASILLNQCTIRSLNRTIETYKQVNILNQQTIASQADTIKVYEGFCSNYLPMCRNVMAVGWYLGQDGMPLSNALAKCDEVFRDAGWSCETNGATP